MKKSLIIILLITCMIFSLSAIAAAEIDENGDTSVELNNIDQNVLNPADSSVSSSNSIDEDTDYYSKNINQREDYSSNYVKQGVDSSSQSMGKGKVISDSSKVNSVQSDNSGLLVKSGTFSELQLLILAAKEGDVIRLTQDYKYDTNFLLKTGIFINKNITIDGNGHTIDGRGKTRIFNINYGKHFQYNKVILKNIKFKNGRGRFYGGAILNFGNLTVNNCYFANNYAGTAGGAINSLGSLNLKNSKFYKNSAGGDAGAVFSLTLKNGASFFEKYFHDKNATEDLELLFSIIMSSDLQPGKDHISNCVFNSNRAKGNGGGAVYAFSHIDIKSSNFNNNRADLKGGAVYGCKDLFIKNSKFNNNKVSKYGGAVYFKCHSQSGYYKKGKWISTIKYYKNKIEGSTFTSNVAGERGGAIYGFKYHDSDKKHCAKAVKCIFSDNKAPNGKDIYGGTIKNSVYKNTKIALQKIIVSKSLKKLTLQALFKKGSAALKNKVVTFKFSGLTFKAKTNSKGIAKVKISHNILKHLKVGNIVIYSASLNGVSAKKYTIVLK